MLCSASGPSGSSSACRPRPVGRQVGVGPVAQRLERGGVALHAGRPDQAAAAAFGQIRILVDAGDRGPPVGDVVGAPVARPRRSARRRSRAPRRTRRGLDVLECSPCRSASCPVRPSTYQEPPAGSSTRPRWDSSSSSSWVLRAMRRAKLPAIPGIPPGIAASNGHQHGVGAADARAEGGERGAQHVHPRVALRHHRPRGDRVLVAAPASGAPTTSATRAQSGARHGIWRWS